MDLRALVRGTAFVLPLLAVLSCSSNEGKGQDASAEASAASCPGARQLLSGLPSETDYVGLTAEEARERAEGEGDRLVVACREGEDLLVPGNIDPRRVLVIVTQGAVEKAARG